MVIGDDAQGKTIGCRLHHRRRADNAARAWLVVDNHRVPQRLGNGNSGGPRDGVHARARGHRQDEADGLVGLGQRWQWQGSTDSKGAHADQCLAAGRLRGNGDGIVVDGVVMVSATVAPLTFLMQS